MEQLQKPGLTVFASNRLEILAEQLAERLRIPLSSPFDKDVIVVQSRGMARWISMELARINGICTQCLFSFPNAFLNYLREKLAPEVSESKAFEPGIFTFCVMKHLTACQSKDGFETIRAYISDNKMQVKLLQLSEKIAAVFDNYLVFRPEMVSEWEAGKTATPAAHAWQADLWREIIAGSARLHRANLRHQLMQKMDGISGGQIRLSDRISVFGVSHLPQFHLQLLNRLAMHVQVNLYLMNPCQEYWGDLVSHREARRIHDRYRRKGIAREDLHLERGNRLLASMGVLGRDFFDGIYAMPCDLIETYAPASGKRMLACIQNDILNLIDTGGAAAEDGPRQYGTLCDAGLPIPQDASIQVHAAHSPMREVEVLHDNLLAMFERSPELQPRDIIVMTPEIEAYAPFIHAVFDSAGEENKRIPFRVTDRNLLSESLVVSAFMALLDLKDSRLETSRVISLLEYPAVRDRFGLTEQDVSMVETWVDDVHIRWGRNAESRSAIGIPAFPENTWQAGIDRLLLGYAMSGEDRRLFSGILPYDHIEGENARCLGKLLQFVDQLFEALTTFEAAKTLIEWSRTFLALIDTMFHRNDVSEREIHLLKQHLSQLQTAQELSGQDAEIEFDAIKTYLQHYFNRQIHDAGFITGGVTFCAMLPMRSIPFKVICLIGLNSDRFPRASRNIGFDLMAQLPLPGDGSKRNDDKYLFLEALLSAREIFYLSFVGQHIQDNSKIMPSVLLSELLDYIQDRFEIPPERMIVYHPLQAYSASYFSGHGPLFSYSMENFMAAESRSLASNPPGLFSRDLSEPSAEWRRLDIETLSNFFTNPARFLLQKRLGIFLADSGGLPEEKEIFMLDGLEKYRVEEEMAQHRLSGFDPAELQPVLKARGVLPYGNVGTYEFERLIPEIEQYVRRLEASCGRRAPDSQEWTDTIADFTLYGTFRIAEGGQMIRHRYARKNPRDMLRLWLYHLIGCSGAFRKGGRESIHIFKDGLLTYRFAAGSRSILEQLLETFWQGLRRPIPFFPLTAYRYAEQRIIRARSEEEAVQAARNQWLSAYGRGECEDPYIASCFSESDALNHEFKRLAEAVYSPLFAHCRFDPY